MMSYAVPPPSKVRPSVVDWAANLLWVVAAAQIVSLVISLLPNDKLDAAIENFKATHPDFQINSSTTVITSVIGIVFTTAVAIALAILAVFLRKGSHPARVVTWVLGGVLTLCQVCAVGGTLLLPSLANQAAENSANQDAIDYAKVVTENTPGWIRAADVVLITVTLVALIAVLVMLAMPASNDFFRKEQEVWVPPTDFPGAGGSGQTPPPAIPQNPPNP